MANTVTVPGGSSTVSVPPSSVAAEFRVGGHSRHRTHGPVRPYDFLLASAPNRSTTISVDGTLGRL